MASKHAQDIEAKQAKNETDFDRMVAAAEDANKTTGIGEDVQGVAILLRQAGVNDTKIAEIQANPSMVALIRSNPDLVARLAKQFPADYAISYYENRQLAGLGLPTEELFASGGPDAMARNIAESGPTTSATGAIEYPGGVFVQDGQVFFPPTDASIMGSPAWMQQIPTWDAAKKETWAKTLKKMGYLDSTEVDLVTFTDALALYNKNRYLYGGGKPVDLSAGNAGVTKKDFGGILDPAVLDTEVRSYHQEIYGANDEPSPEELKRGREFLEKNALRIARKQGLDPADAANVASARAQRKFRNDPATQRWQEMEETDTSLHDSFVSLFQALS